MAPTIVAEDRLTSGHRLSHPPPGDEVLITGVSGYFPDSDSVVHLQENLFNKVDLVTADERQWRLLNPEIPQRAGKINNLSKFDASFFGINFREAHTMDPMGRILLEKAYEAIFDAGVNPEELRHTKTGVFVSAGYSESENTWVQENMQVNGFGLTGCSRAMLANRISYWLGVTGPSYTVDSACSSSQYALEHAFRAIRNGHCDSAIVCGSSLCLNPCVTLVFSRSGVLSSDGRCKCFDNSANGYVRSEAIAAVFLQKAKNSRRAYAQLLYARTNCDGYKEQGIMFPSEDTQVEFLKEFYEECSVLPHSLEYFEAHGTGTQVGDLIELQSIDKVFGSGRSEPLNIGSVKSNLGHSESASGLCSIAKMCIAYSTGYIPPNLYYETPREGAAGLADRRLQVVTEMTPWKRGMCGINGFGFGGANAHLLLKNFAGDKVNNGIPLDDLPRLICVSGRTESAVAKILNDLESRTVDGELVRLLHSIHETNIQGHVVRGYSLLGSTPTKSVPLARDVQYFSGVRRPVWFVYSGMGSQWASMATELMRIPVFAAAIQKCHKVLEPKRINLTKIITEADPKIYDNILNSFVGIAAVQIGLTDVLTTVGIEPDYIIGHDMGELGCAYAEGSVTAEKTICSAYSRGLVCMRSVVDGSISTEDIKFNQNPVPFEETCSQIHPHAITVEVAPHGILLPTLRKSVKDAFNIPLQERNNKNNILVLLNVLGQLYEMGLNPHLANIYPHVPFPVSQGTPMLAHLVEWEHSEDWCVPFSEMQLNKKIGERTVKISLEDQSWEYLSGHNLDGRILYPATGYLVLVWETFGMMFGKPYIEVSVVFENVRFHRATAIPKDGSLEFIITIHKGSGDFEITESSVPVATGKIYTKKNIGYNVLPFSSEVASSSIKLLSKDFYKEMRLRALQHSGQFQGVQEWDIQNNCGRLNWVNNWVTFLDSMMQVETLNNHDTRDPTVPTAIEKLSIDVEMHYSFTSLMNPNSETNCLEIRLYHDPDVIRSGGVEIRCVHVTHISKIPDPDIPILEQNEFCPNFGQEKVEAVLRIYVQLIIENIQTYTVKGIELADDEYKSNGYEPILGKVENIFGDLMNVRADLLLVSEEHTETSHRITVANKKLHGETDIVMFIGANLLGRSDVLQQAISTLRDKCFIISREKERPDPQQFSDKYDIVCVHDTGVEYLVLFRKRVGVTRRAKFIKIVTSDQTYAWIDKVKNYLNNGQKLVLYSQNEPINGLLGLVNCLCKETGSEIVSGLLIVDPAAPAFDPELEFYKEQLDKDLAINVYQNGKWGTYRHLLLEELKTVRANHAYVNMQTIGKLSSLRWLEGHLRENHVFKNPQDIPIHVYCAALNFHDIMMVTGRFSSRALVSSRISQECVLGKEIAGKTFNGTRVMGIVRNCGLANLAVGFKPMLMPVPDEWSFEEAASVPVAYSTVYYAMVMVGRIKRGESILIHAGSGGVGQAAINVALHYNCEIFTTVGTAEKRAFIKKLFPQLKDSHIGSSRDISFEDMIRRETNGKGVHLVLNSLSEDKLQASVRCLGSLGRFLELGKFDIINNTPIDMLFFNKEISFYSIMLDYIIDSFEVNEIQRLRELILAGIKNGVVRPLTYCTFNKTEVEAAFRYMAAGKHVGKVIIKIRDEEHNSFSTKPTNMTIEATPRYTCHEDHVYIVVGGLGGFGLELADWLILRGARKIMLTSRRGVVNGYQSYRLGTWASYGADVRISTDDITTEAGCEAMLNAANAMGSVEAIFNLAVILKDSIFQNQTPDTFRTSYGPKALATMHLDKLSTKLCPGLKDFVVFSSVSCGRGNANQTNYGLSNSAMERLCEKRKIIGLPALAIQWGAIGDVGLLADIRNQLEVGGTRQQSISSCLLALDKMMKQDAAIVSSMVVAEKMASASDNRTIIDTIAQIMGIKDLNMVSQQVSLAELGMDSLTAVVIKQTLEREFGVFVTSQDIRTMTFPKLLDLSLSTKKGVPSSTSSQPVHNVPIPGKISSSLEALMRDFRDESIASKPFIYMLSMVSEDVECEETRKQVLFVVPGLEGFVTMLEPLCRQLKIKVCVLQLGVEHQHEDLDAMVSRLHQIITSILAPGAPFWLLGYSFGSMLVLELASRLEAEGLKGTVFCLDGSVDYLHATLTAHNFKNDFNLQNRLLCHIIDIIAPSNQVMKLMEKLNKIESYDGRVKVTFEDIPAAIQEIYSAKFISAITAACYDRIKIISNYDPKNFKKLKSPIVLLRTIQNTAIVALEEDYGLNKLTEGSVTVHQLEGNHVSIIENKHAANIINKVLVEEDKNREEISNDKFKPVKRVLNSEVKKKRSEAQSA